MAKAFIRYTLVWWALILFQHTSMANTEGVEKQKQQDSEVVRELFTQLSNCKDSANIQNTLEKILDVASENNDIVTRLKAYDQAGVVCRNISRYNQALSFHKKSLELAQTLNDESYQISPLNNIGVVYRRIDEFKQALDYHLKALKMAEKINDKKSICISVNSIGNIYLSLGQYKEALNCFNRSLPLEMERNNLLGVSINYHNIGYVYEAQKNYEKALEYYYKSLDCDIKINHKPGIAICYNAIGEIYSLQLNYKKALDFFTKALDIHMETNDLIYVAVSYNHIANIYLKTNDYQKGITNFRNGLAIALKIGSKSSAQKAYEGLSECYKSLKIFDKALENYQESIKYSDSIMNEANIRHINLIHTQYETERNLHQIKLLEKEKQTTQLTTIIISTIAGFVFIVLIFSFLNIKQKRKIDKQELELKEQTIRELEKDKQIFASHAVLQGEEAERQRLARDLHDGLGGMLSAVKLQLSSIKGSMVVSTEKAHQFEKALFMLDNSIKELRTVAHNMMPDALIKFGLKDAFEDFCDKISSTKIINIRFQFYGENIRLDKSLEIALYRIGQELINNVIKHAKASEAIIQLLYDENRVHLTVQDNGIGFDPTRIDIHKSTGLQSIKARVETFNGRFDIASEKEKGTEISVEFKFTKG